MISESVRDGLLLDLYAGVRDPERLRRFMQEAANAVGSHVAALTRRNNANRTGVTMQAVGAGADVANILRYEAEFIGSRENLWYERALPAIRTGSVIHGDDWASSREIKRTRYYADFLHGLDTLYSVAMCGVLRPPESAVLTFCRSERLGPFGEDELRLLRGLGAHWVNAYQLMSQHEYLGQLAELHAPPTFLLDRQLRWVGGNPAAEVMAGSGWWAARRNALLLPADPASRSAWNRAVRMLARGDGSSAGPVPICASGAVVAFATVRPYGRHAAGEDLPEYVATVETVGGAREGDLAASLRAMFGLTPSEAALAVALRHEDDLGRSAARLGIAPGSARTRLQAVFEKTGVRRQLDLVRMLDALAASLKNIQRGR